MTNAEIIGYGILSRWTGNERMRLRQKLLTGRKIENLIRGLFTVEKIVYGQ